MYSEKAVKSYEAGRLLHQQKKLSAAERAYRKAIKADPKFFEAYNNLGNVLVDREQLKQAFGAYQNALKIMPNHPLLLNNLGHVLKLQGEEEKAINWFNKAIAQDSNYADPHVNLGNALRDTDRHKEAISAYRQAIKIDPRLVEAFINLGILFNNATRFDDAIPVLENAIEIDPYNATTWLVLGDALNGAGESRKAIDAYKKVLEIDSGYTNAYARLAGAFRNLKQWDKAIENYQQAIAHEPDTGLAYMGLSTLKNLEQDKKMIEVMEQKYQDPGISHQDLIHFSFALGKAHADLANYDKSFAYFQRGNQLRWDSLEYDVYREIEFFEKLKTAFEAGAISPFDYKGSIEINPIFIIGLPRSGKTLSETMLARHPQIAAAGERGYLKETLGSLEDLSNPGAIVEHLKCLSGDETIEIAQNYLKKIERFSVGEKLVIDTMPTNFYYVGFIKSLFPGAKVIHCHRQPMDACWFVYQMCFHSDRYLYSFDLDALAVYYRGYSDLVSHWHKVFPGFIYDLEYEKLVTDTQHELSKLFSFLGIEWDGVGLEQYENVPLHDKGIGFWRHYEQHLGALLRVLN